MKSTTLIGIPADQLADCWEKIKHWIAEACDRGQGKYDPVDILRILLRGEMQLWAAISEEKIEGICIGQIVNYPRKRIYAVLCATGEDMVNWYSHINGIERWASLQGCSEIDATTRPGWEKILKPLGYKKFHVQLRKGLAQETMQ